MRASHLIYPVILFGIVVLPHFLDAYSLYLLNLTGLSIVLLVGLNFVTGYTGQVALGHAGFMAIGAYASGLAMTKLGFPFGISLLFGGFLACFCGLIVGFPALRVSGAYLALVTLAFGAIIHLMIIHWPSLTRGSDGISIPAPSLGSIVFSSDRLKFYIIAPITLLLVILAKNIINSRIGKYFLALRQSEIASQSIGINVSKYKVLAFSLSALYAGIAGGLYGTLKSFIHPDDFTLLNSIFYLMMVVIGGLGTISGSIIGAVLLVILPEALRGLQDFRILIYGILLLLFIIFLPNGVMEVIEKSKPLYPRLGRFIRAPYKIYR